jgi:hypothetical protein
MGSELQWMCHRVVPELLNNSKRISGNVLNNFLWKTTPEQLRKFRTEHCHPLETLLIDWEVNHDSATLVWFAG